MIGWCQELGLEVAFPGLLTLCSLGESPLTLFIAKASKSVEINPYRLKFENCHA